MASEKILTVTQENFEASVLQSELPVLIDFWAVWCGPCRVVAPVLEELAEELDGKVRIGKVNVDENQELAMQYRVSSIPTFVLFKGGQPVDATRGAIPKAAFKQFLDSNLA